MITLIALINALIAVESHGDKSAVGKDGEVGILQIRQCVVEDVNRVYHTSYRLTDRANAEAAIRICQLYLGYWGARYEEREHKQATLEVFARIWNGGPNGWKKESTKAYWAKVEKEIGRARK